MKFYTTEQLQAEEARRSFTRTIMKIGPNGGAPLWGLSGLAKKVAMKDIVHAYWTKTMQFPKAVLATAVDDSGGSAGDTTTFVVDSTAHFKPNSVIRIRVVGGGTFDPPELVRVSSITNSTTMEVERGFAGTTPKTTIAADQLLVEVGNAYAQGSVRPISRAIRPVRHINNSQIFRDGWDVTGTLSAVELEVGNGAVADNKEDAMFFHAQAVEKSAWFGYQSESIDSTSNNPITTMDGVEAIIGNYAPGNMYEAGSTTNFDQLEEYLNPLFDYNTDAMNGNVRTMFCGGKAKQVINQIGVKSGNYQLMDDQTSFGMRFSRFKTSRGDFELIEHPLFNTNEEWKKMAFVMDLSVLDFPTLRDTFHKEYAHDGVDAIGGSYTTELSFELKNPFACGVIYDLTAAAS